MTPELAELFDKQDDEFLKDERLSPHPLTKRRDLRAFLLLESILPATNGRDMVTAAEHDEIWLDIDPEELAKVITEEQIIELIRCGVRYDAGIDSLCMFV